MWAAVVVAVAVARRAAAAEAWAEAWTGWAACVGEASWVGAVGWVATALPVTEEWVAAARVEAASDPVAGERGVAGATG